MRKILLLAFLAIGLARADAQSVMIPVSLYGYLDQYSMNTPSNSIGSEACVPTSTTNALTYLQNAYPELYGTTLSGAGYDAWKATDSTLIADMQTTVESGGTGDPQEVYGLNQYLGTLNLGANYPSMSGIMSDAGWGGLYPQPSYIGTGLPDASFLANALQSNAALITTITYTNGNGGHCLLVNGIQWDAETGIGTLYFVDPLDPSQNYDASSHPEVLGPVLQTSGTIRLHEDGKLHLLYNQYEGELPFDGSSGNFSMTDAYIDGALALYAIPEPSIMALGLIGLAVLVGRRRYSRC